jgi:hypothetical protein
VAVTGPNHVLRGNAARLTADPYSQGWLFEGVDADDNGLLPGTEARAWMAREVERMLQLVRGRGHWRTSLADGGEFHPRVLDSLDREERFQVLHEFFSPYAKWKRES